MADEKQQARSDLDFLDRFAGGNVVRSWLSEIVYTRGYRSGHSLRTKLDDAGIADANWRSERWLNVLAVLGWVQRGKPELTREMRFYGIGGMTGETIAAVAPKNPTAVSPIAFAWGIEDPRAPLDPELLAWLNLPV